jgi:predicted short-subunit dehydrogenase-like oxidoreductase (DUF2520 family)
MNGGIQMGIGFIGAGKVGTAFGRYLHDHGLTISGFFDRHPEKVSHACYQTNSRACSSAAELARISQIVMITTRDDQIAGMCRRLCAEQVIGTGHLVGHMSGAHASLILKPAADKGAAVFSLHPLQAFADEQKALADLAGTYFSLEGSDQRLATIETVLDKLGNPFLKIAPEHKTLYHLAACILSNYLVTLIDLGLQALAQSGIEGRKGFVAMLPLIQGTIENIRFIGTRRALTGPIARCDASTLQQHLEALETQGLSELKEFYTSMGLRTLKLATKKLAAENSKATEIQKILQS